MRTDPNRRKHVPADAHPDEQREGTRHARRAAKAEAREPEAREGIWWVADRFADMLKEHEQRHVIEQGARAVWPWGLPFSEGGQEPPGCERFDLELLEDLRRAFKSFNKRRSARGKSLYPKKQR